MSGIVGILNFDGTPVDRALLGRMTAFMGFRGPDAQETWAHGHVGFGHALLQTTDESEGEHQPFTLDGRHWIVADARVDAQADLIAELTACGEDVRQGATDVELLLRAYRVWGEECVLHLLGDFAFAIWDGPSQRLFCARDHLGVKPFFYAHLGHTLIFSNTLQCIRQHPLVSSELNDLAIADFLLFDMNQDQRTTTFVDIQRIPPAHRATWSRNAVSMSRYWSMPIDEPVFFRRAGDYIDRFKELLQQAVDDRLRTNRVGIFMSGGLDSPALAATACRILRNRRIDAQVTAFTTVIDPLDNNERLYATFVAEHLGIPIHFRDLSNATIEANWDRNPAASAEPVTNATSLVADRAEFASASKHARVWFYGEGPDNALKYEWSRYLRYLAQKRRFGRLLGDVAGHMIRHRRVPLLSTIPRMLRDRRSRDSWNLHFPAWIAGDFESRLKLRRRWDEVQQAPGGASAHPVRPRSHSSFDGFFWEPLFRSLDAEETAAAMEVRHPFTDLRLVRFLLTIPAIPWCRSKYLLRRGMRGVLPSPVLRRPKTSLSSDPAWEIARRSKLRPMVATERLRDYVDSSQVPSGTDSSMMSFRTDYRPVALNYWLRQLGNELQTSHQHDRRGTAA